MWRTFLASARAHKTHVAAAFILLVAGWCLWSWVRTRRQRRSSCRARRAFDAGVHRRARQQKQLASRLSAQTPWAQQASTAQLVKMARIAHYGMTGQYTSEGDFIEGVAPDARRALVLYEELMRRDVPEAILPYAELLEHGIPSDDASVVDPQRALALYASKYHSVTDPYDKYQALQAMLRLSPEERRPGVMQEMSRVAASIKAQQEARAATRPRPTPPAAAAAEANTNTNARRTTGQDIWQATAEFRAPLPERDAPTVNKNAGQHNTHDSGVTQTARTSVERLRRVMGGAGADPVSAARDVRQLLQQAEVSEDRRERAILALDAIERNDATLSGMGASELEVLGLVWGRIHHEDNAANQKVLRENLVDELSEAVEFGKPVCATGRFTRLLDTLQGTDELVQIKPKWVMQQEMVDKAGAMYRSAVEALPPHDKRAMEALDPTPEQQEAYDRVMGKVKQDIRSDFTKAYVQEGVLTPEALDVELSKWIDHIG